MRHASSTLGFALVLSGCTGFSLGENGPGGDTWTEPPWTGEGEHRVGAIAVERDEDQLWVVHQENRGGDLRAHLSAIDPATRATTEVLDVTGFDDRRVVFPAADRMLLLAQQNGMESLVLFDTTTDQRIASTTKPTWYWGTRTSPSGRALVVADNAATLAPLHVIDTATLKHQVLAHDGEAIEAMWNHSSDVLLAVSVADPFTDHPVAKLLRYDLAGVDLAAPLPAPTTTWQLGGYDWDFLFSFTWIGISPDDRWAVFPLIKRTIGPADYQHVLLVLDQTTGALSEIPGSGPVGFTRDSKYIVSYGPRTGGGGEDLWLIDPKTRARTTIAMPWAAAISYFVMHDSDHVIVTPVLGGTLNPVVVDTVTLEQQTVARSSLSLHDFVSRPGHDELFLDSHGQLIDLSLATASAVDVQLPFGISSINVRPTADEAIVADANAATLYPVAMATRTAGAAIPLPSPFTAAAADRLAAPTTSGRVSRTDEPRLRTRREHDGDAISLDLPAR
jgi:hypothetical protein